jgi:hypothetical protein
MARITLYRQRCVPGILTGGSSAITRGVQHKAGSMSTVTKTRARVTYYVTLALGIGRKGYFNPFPGLLIGYDETCLCDRESVDVSDVTDERASFVIKRLQFHHNLGGTRTTAWDGA